MIVRNGIRSNLRSKGRTALFAGMILVLTLGMILALGVRSYCDSALAQFDKAYRSIAVLEYMGAEYPSIDEPDPAARAASAAIDDSALSAVPGVTAWYRDCHTLSRVEGFQRRGIDMPYKDRGVIVVTHIVPVYPAQLGIMGQPDYYTGLLTRSLYSYTEKENILITILYDDLPEDLEKDGFYVLHGTFVEGDEEGIHNGLACFKALPFSDDPGTEPCYRLGEGEEPPEIFSRYADHFRTINNYVHTVVCGNLEDLWEFHQGVVYPREGRMPEGPDECIVSGGLAESMDLSVGMTLELTDFDSEEGDRYEITLTDRHRTVTVTGITNSYEDYYGYIWQQKEQTPATLFGYRIGIAELENSQAVDAAAALEEMMPANVRVTLLDQGYTEAVEPFLSLQSTSTNVLLLCAAGTAAVLVLFARLFVGRQNDTVRILVSLGTPRRKIALWLLSGALVIAGGAAVLGGLLGILGLPAVYAAIRSRIAAGSEILRFSETLVTTMKKVDVPVRTPLWPILLTIGAIILFAFLLCFLFLGVAYRGGTLRQGRSRVRVPSGRTSTFGSGAFRYAVLSLRRGGRRALLVVAVCAVLTVMLILLGGVYRGWEIQLQDALSGTELEGQVTSLDGRDFSGLILPIHTIQELLMQEDVSDVYVSIRDVYWMPEDLPGIVREERRNDWIDAQAEFVCTNDLKGTKEFYFTEPEIQWTEGWDASCLSDDSYATIYGPLLYLEKDKIAGPYPAVVSDAFLESHGLTPGCGFSCMIRGGGVLQDEISVPLIAAGVYHQTGSKAHMYLPLAAFVPPDVIFGETPQEGSSYWFRNGRNTEENYRAFIYDYYMMETCRFTLVSAAHLEQTRDNLDRAGFGWPGHVGQRRTTLILRDASFVKLTENLGRYLSMGRVMLGLIFGIVALLGFIISWLLVSGRKQEFAVMRGLGVKKGRLFLSFFWEQALLCLAGCAIGCIAMKRFYAGGALQWLVLGAFAVCYMTGCALSVILIGKMNLMELLSAQE